MDNKDQEWLALLERVRRRVQEEMWHRTVLEAGRYRENPAACYIPNCDRNSEVALKGLISGRVNYYCARCASELLEEFSEFFSRVERETK